MSAAGRRIRLDLAYDGTDFAGWQVQPGLRTVQGLVAGSLERIQGGGRVAVRGAGRTDAGVHALGQVADAWIVTRLDDGNLTRALRSLLPPDVRVRALRTVDSTFHARYDAVGKTYLYRIDRSQDGDPFLARFSLHHPFGFDADALQEALRLLPGCRDWSGFASAACDKVDRVRTLDAALWDDDGSSAGVFRFSADGFLTHMVRNLVGTLLEIARGRFAPARVVEILASGDRRLGGPTAPARGLFLDRVRYRDEPESGPGPRAAFPLV